MSFLECINTAVAAGKLSQKKAGEAETAYEKAKQNFITSGMAEDAADYAASHAALESVTQLKSADRKARIFEMRKQHRLYTEIHASKDPGEKLTDLAQESANVYKATLGQLARIADKLLQKYSPKLAGWYIPVKDMDEVVKGIYGKSVSAEAQAMAKAAQELMEFDRNLLNLEGASIPENKNFRLTQSHRRELVHEAGEEKWVSEHLSTVNGEDVLDWDLMRFKGKPIAVEDREAVLRSVWKNIITNATKEGAESLITRLSRERFLYYKTPEAWIKMQGKYGTGNFFHQLVEQMDGTARAVSLMRTFGPNPDAGKRFAEQAANNKLKSILLGVSGKKGEKLRRQLKNQMETFDAAYKIHARDVDTGAGDALAITMANARTWSTTQLLGSAIISNLSDPVYGMWMRGVRRLPQLSVIPRYFSAITNFKDFRQQMIDNGIVYESFINRAHEGTRYNLTLEGSHVVKAVSDINYRMQGLSAWTEIGRGVAGLQIAQVFAKVRGMKFDEVPFVHLMRTFGVTEADWEAFRAIPLYEPQYYKFGSGKMLRPIDMYNQAASDAMRESANKMLMFQEAVVRDGIPFPNLKVRAALAEHLPAGQLYTQFFRTMTQLMLFPASVHYQYMKQIFYAPRYVDKLWRLGTFMAYTTMAGAMITQLKDVLNGKELHPMNTKEFWIRSMLNGGAGGILGDFLYDGGLLVATPYGANTPLGQNLEAIARLTKDIGRKVFGGEDRPIGKDAARLAWGLFPFKLPGLKLVVERSIMDPILEQSDPAAYARKIRAQEEWEQDQGQGTWWGVGE